MSRKSGALFAHIGLLRCGISSKRLAAVRGATIAYTPRVQRGAWIISLLGLLSACGSNNVGTDELDVKVDTESELAWQQYLANLEFAKSYAPRCDLEAAEGADHRVLVTGFGRFQSNSYNATGGMVSELIAELDYPETTAPPSDEVDLPGPQTAVAQGVLELPGAGKVFVCAMVLPVFWDLAPYLIAQELAAFRPDMVLMNGIAGWRQEVWLELGAVNKAKRLGDGSNNLRPEEDLAPLVPSADATEYARANLASWDAMRTAIDGALEQETDLLRDGVAFGDVVHGTLLAGFPRSSNTYLCNNVTYTVGYLMDHHADEVTLMEASHVRDGVDTGLDVTLGVDMSNVPRLFMHWPSDLRGEHLPAGAALMRAAIDAQLTALGSESDAPARGDNDIAELPANETIPNDDATF